MAVFAILLPLIFDFEGFPLLFIRLPVPAEHVPPFMDAEILGDDEDPAGQDQGDHDQNHKQRAQNMHELRTYSENDNKKPFPSRMKNQKGKGLKAPDRQPRSRFHPIGIAF
jgi:hypothetical protein